ncbi:MAG: ATP-binding protein, partial [Bacteroidota bacterium]
MSNHILNELIAQGENSAVEFKRDGVGPDDLAKEIVAMLNRDGGVILIGGLFRLLQQSGVYHFDSTIISNAGLEELNQTKLNEYFTQ